MDNENTVNPSDWVETPEGVLILVLMDNENTI